MIFWNLTHKNIPDRQKFVAYRKSQKVLNHSTLLHNPFPYLSVWIFFQSLVDLETAFIEQLQAIKKCMKNPRNVYLDIQALEAMPTGCQEVETGMNPAVDGRGSKQDITVCKTIVFLGQKAKDIKQMCFIFMKKYRFIKKH